MRAKGLPVDGEAKRLAGGLDVMMEQLQLGLGRHTDPYDAGPTKVRKGANAANLDVDGAIALADTAQRVREPRGEIVRLLTEKLDGEMQLWLSHPGEVGSDGAKRSRRLENGAADGRIEINREKETHDS